LVEGHHYQIDPITGCWEWLLYRTYQGYGSISAGRGGAVYNRAHRESWRLVHGPIPEGMVIDHLCRNKGCVNPEHLDCVRQSTNVQRGVVAKLTEHDVKVIRERIVAGDTLTAIGKDYGVHLDAIYRIAEDSRWRDDPDAPAERLMPKRDCPTCGLPVIAQRRNQRYCSKTCQRRRRRSSVPSREFGATDPVSPPANPSQTPDQPKET
jgi:hypothetical protein